MKSKNNHIKRFIRPDTSFEKQINYMQDLGKVEDDNNSSDEGIKVGVTRKSSAPKNKSKFHTRFVNTYNYLKENVLLYVNVNRLAKDLGINQRTLKEYLRVFQDNNMFIIPLCEWHAEDLEPFTYVRFKRNYKVKEIKIKRVPVRVGFKLKKGKGKRYFWATKVTKL